MSRWLQLLSNQRLFPVWRHSCCPISFCPLRDVTQSRDMRAHRHMAVPGCRPLANGPETFFKKIFHWTCSLGKVFIKHAGAFHRGHENWARPALDQHFVSIRSYCNDVSYFFVNFRFFILNLSDSPIRETSRHLAEGYHEIWIWYTEPEKTPPKSRQQVSPNTSYLGVMERNLVWY